MGLQCNLDQRGRSLRIVVGALMEGPGLLLLYLRFVGVLQGEWPWFVGGFLVTLGWFVIAQGLMGWCAIRALGARE